MFLIRLHPNIGESLSSWRLRNGLVNGFKTLPRPKGASYLIDPDTQLKTDEEKWVLENVGQTSPALQGMTLDHINAIISKDQTKSRIARWVLATGNGSNALSPGPAVCACRLAKGSPYYKLAWRYGFSTYCHEHQKLLIDRCPTCSQKMWPHHYYQGAKQRQLQLGLCHHCGAHLNTSESTSPPHTATPDTWNWISINVVPGEYSCTRELSDFFDALWSTCQLLGRKSTFKLWEHIPNKIVAQASSSLSSPFQKFELASISVRHATFSAALWLLQDWPNRFLQTCLSAKVYKSAALPNSVYAPQFFSRAIDESLSQRKRNIITTSDVEKTIDNLSQQGLLVTKNQVRKTLGVQESKAIDSLLNQRRQGTLREFLLFCGTFEKLIKETSPSRDQLATLKRDYLIFLVSVFIESSIEAVCALSKDEVIEILNRPIDEFKHSSEKRLVCLRAKSLNEEYAEYFLSETDEPPSERWFIGRFGNPLDGHSVRSRISKLMANSMEQKLWSSADAFKLVLSDYKIYGRRLNQTRHSDKQLLLL